MARCVWHSLCSLWHSHGRYQAALAGNGWEEMFVCSSAGAQGVSAPAAPVLRCQGDLKAQAGSCSPAGAGVGSQAELPHKSSLSEKKCPAAFAFAVVCGGKGSLAEKSSAVDSANGRISHSLG